MEKKEKLYMKLSDKKNIKNNMISIQKISDRIIKFFHDYKSIDNFRSYAPNFFKKKLNGNVKCILIDLWHLLEFDPYLYYQIINFPTEMISIFDYAINNLFLPKIKNVKKLTKKRIKVFFLNTALKQKLKITVPDPKNLNKLFFVYGVVSKISFLVPELTSGFFKCEICCFETYSFLEKGKLIEPIYCFSCKNFHSFRLVYNRSSFENKMHLCLQQLPGKSYRGEQLSSLVLLVHGENNKKIQKGSFVEVAGILRISSDSEQNFFYPTAFFQFYLDVLFIKNENFRFFDNKSFYVKKFPKNNYSKKKAKNEILVMHHSSSQNPSMYLNLVDSIFPDLFGFNTLKQGILVLIIKSLLNNYSNKILSFTNPINILLIGKKRICKTQILKFVEHFVKSSIFVDGEDFFKDEEIDLEISSSPKKIKFENILNYFISKRKKILCIDQINNLPNHTLNLFEEIIKKKNISISNLSLVFTIKHKISVLGTIELERNFKDISNKNLSYFPFKMSCIQGFDLVYLAGDSSSNFYDKRLAQHILKSFIEPSDSKILKKKRNVGIGITIKTLSTLLSFREKHSGLFFSEISTKELVKCHLICTFFQKYKFDCLHFDDCSIWKLLLGLIENFSWIRFSNIAGLEDIRFAGIVFLEALKSWKNSNGIKLC